MSEIVVEEFANGGFTTERVLRPRVKCLMEVWGLAAIRVWKDGVAT